MVFDILSDSTKIQTLIHLWQCFQSFQEVNNEMRDIYRKLQEDGLDPSSDEEEKLKHLWQLYLKTEVGNGYTVDYSTLEANSIGRSDSGCNKALTNLLV